MVNKGSSGIAPKQLPILSYELKNADDFEEWQKALEAYSLANNSWALIFEPYERSLEEMIMSFGSYRTREDICQAHREWCGKLFGVMYQSVMKLTGNVLLGEIRERQALREVDVLHDPHHLLGYISEKYEAVSSFSRSNDLLKVFSMVYDPSQNPAELRERLLTKIIRYQDGDRNRISEDMKKT